jgi:putative transposase
VRRHTYLWAQGRWHYLAVVLDLFTRRVVGWLFSTSPDADLVVKALDMAFEQRGRPTGLMFHSDQGGQYASRKFRQRLWRYRIRQSMSRRGNCWDTQSLKKDRCVTFANRFKKHSFLRLRRLIERGKIQVSSSRMIV